MPQGELDLYVAFLLYQTMQLVYPKCVVCSDSSWYHPWCINEVGIASNGNTRD